MTEYIDKEKLLQKLSRMIEYCKNDNKVNGLTALFQVGDAIMNCPTTNVVSKSEVVEEIIGEVRQALLNMVLANAVGETYDLEKFFAELKKRYS